MRLLTLLEAANYLAISKTTLRRLIATKAIRYSQAGRWGRIRFRHEWLDEFIDRHTVARPDIHLSKPKRKPTSRAKADTPFVSRHGLDL